MNKHLVTLIQSWKLSGALEQEGFDWSSGKDNWINAFPTKSYSIKDLAPLAKFEWSVPMAGGANSLFKYKDAINKCLDQSARDDAIAWLDAYNRDDVRATFAVRNFIRSLNFG